MTNDWTNFTPWASLSGGILLGVASAFFILINGRVLGIRGILGGLLPPKLGDVGWRIAFLLGMLALGATSLPAAANPRATALQAWKDPHCGCCKAWIVHMDGAQTRDMLAMSATTQTTGIVQLGMISAAGASCSEWDEEY